MSNAFDTFVGKYTGIHSITVWRIQLNKSTHLYEFALGVFPNDNEINILAGLFFAGDSGCPATNELAGN